MKTANIGVGTPSSNPQLTITVSFADFGKLISGKLNPNDAFMKGQVKVKGNMTLAMGLDMLMKNLRSVGKFDSTL